MNIYLMPRRFGRKNLIRRNSVNIRFSPKLGRFDKLPQICGATCKGISIQSTFLLHQLHLLTLWIFRSGGRNTKSPPIRAQRPKKKFSTRFSSLMTVSNICRDVVVIELHVMLMLRPFSSNTLTERLCWHCGRMAVICGPSGAIECNFTFASLMSISWHGKLEFRINSGPRDFERLAFRFSSSLLPITILLGRRTRRFGKVAKSSASLRSAKAKSTSENGLKLTSLVSYLASRICSSNCC